MSPGSCSWTATRCRWTCRPGGRGCWSTRTGPASSAWRCARTGWSAGLYASQCGPTCAPLDAAGVDLWRRPLQQRGTERALLANATRGVIPAMTHGAARRAAALGHAPARGVGTRRRRRRVHARVAGLHRRGDRGAVRGARARAAPDDDLLAGRRRDCGPAAGEGLDVPPGGNVATCAPRSVHKLSSCRTRGVGPSPRRSCPRAGRGQPRLEPDGRHRRGGQPLGRSPVPVDRPEAGRAGLPVLAVARRSPRGCAPTKFHHMTTGSRNGSPPSSRPVRPRRPGWAGSAAGRPGAV